jgi:hypothetical protein
VSNSGAELVLIPFFTGARKTAKGWTGNGGRMANTKQEKLAACKKRVRAAKKKEPISGCDLGRSNCSALGCTNCDLSSAEILRKIACQTVRRDGSAIANSLSRRASAGDATSAKLLLSLAEAKLAKAGGKKKKAGRSQAMELAAEPEWQEPVAEFFAETSGGRREREG